MIINYRGVFMTVYQYDVEQVNGEKVSLTQYKGKVLLIVNTASQCTYTPQFEDLQKLYEQFQGQGFEILGFPCNQFGEQEPGTNEEAVSFCQMNYGVTFPVFSKIKVNGENANPLYKYLKQKAPFKGFDEANINEKLLKMMISEKNPEWLVGNEIKWNFTKFLINQEGEVIKRYEPSTEPLEIKSDISQIIKR